MAHPQQRKPACPRCRELAVDWIADLIWDCELDGQDVHDIAYAVDWEPEQDYAGRAGTQLHAYLLAVTKELDESAADLIQSATETVLGWPVAS